MSGSFTRCAGLAVLLALSGCGEEPSAPPFVFNESGEELRDLVSQDLVTGEMDTTRFGILEDSTVAIAKPGSDTLILGYQVVTALGLFIEEAIAQERIQQPVFDLTISEGDVYINLIHAIPVPAALMLALAAPLAVLLVIAYLVRRLRQERVQRVLLQKTGRQLAESREDERKRLARELHDGPLQTLHALRMQLGVALDTLQKKGGVEEMALRRIAGIQDETHTVVGELRGITESLRPPSLVPFGLAAALRSHAERFRRLYPRIALHLDLEEDGQRLDVPTRLVLFRVAQEALANAAKHASPRDVALSLSLGSALATLCVEDDGTGLAEKPDSSRLAARGHFGFIGMEERIATVDGRLTIGPGHMGGTVIRAEVPFTRADMETT